MVRFNERDKHGIRLSIRYSHILGLTTVILVLIRSFSLSNIFDTTVLLDPADYELFRHNNESLIDDGSSVERDTSSLDNGRKFARKYRPDRGVVVVPQSVIVPPVISEHTPPPSILSTDLLQIGTADLWEQICIEGGTIATRRTKHNTLPRPPIIAMEVGMFILEQCYFAADQGMHAHCVEPSPKNYRRVIDQIEEKKKIDSMIPTVERISTYNVAAGDATGATVPFFGNGGTGDHIGEFDAWNMVKGLEGEKDYPRKKKSKRTDVPMVKIDDIINNRIVPTNREENDPLNPKIQDVFALKVDTQGFEPAVFSGLKESIERKKIHFILFEYWPKGMDLLSSGDTKCAASVAILKQLDAANYKLYALRVEAHPKAGNASDAMNTADAERPFDDFETNCNWYYEFEKRFPNAGYKMGYWSDIFAVSPNAKLSEPVTEIGKLLARNL